LFLRFIRSSFIWTNSSKIITRARLPILIQVQLTQLAGFSQISGYQAPRLFIEGIGLNLR
jgi:hypothetical protein